MMFPKRHILHGPRSTRVSLIHKLDRIISEFIRLRDIYQSSRGIHYIKCVTCGRFVEWRLSDCGHFISRNHLSTRYSELNMAAQCQWCNRFQSGKQFEFGLEIDRRHGKGTSEMLLKISHMKSKFQNMWYEVKLKYYRSEVKKMKIEKGII